jgi:5-(carboxyamino)imidazole ribonucleotide mutase
VSRVVIVAGSGGDAAHVDAIKRSVEKLGVRVVTRVASAHKVPEFALSVVRRYDNDGIATVFITVAGRSNALSAFADAAVVSPVIACPPPSDAYAGADIWSSLRMPSGVCPMVVLEPANAALAAVKMLALHSPGLRDSVSAAQQAGAAAVYAADAAAWDAAE